MKFSLPDVNKWFVKSTTKPNTVTTGEFNDARRGALKSTVKGSWVVISFAILLAILYYIHKRFSASTNVRKVGKLVSERCLNVDVSDTIFVAIYAYRDPRVADTIVDLFRTAYCPNRVYIGLYHHAGESEFPVMKRYELAARNAGQPSYAAQCRVLTVSANQRKGQSWGLSVIMTTLLRNEKYTMIVEPGSRFIDDWDVLLLNELNKVIELNSGNTQVILSQTPLRRPWHIRNSKKVAKSSDKITFKRFKGWRDNSLPIPTFETCVSSGPALRPMLNNVADSNFLFAATPVFQHIPFDKRLYFLDKDDFDWLMTLRYWTHGFTLWTPSQSVISLVQRQALNVDMEYEISQPPPMKAHLREQSYHALYAILGIERWPPTEGIDHSLGKAKTLQSFAAAFGLDFVKQKVSDSALLGLCHSTLLRTLENEEVVTKYGAWTDALYMREVRRAAYLGTEDEPYAVPQPAVGK